MEKKKQVMRSTGRGGAGNWKQTKPVVALDSQPRKMLEVETARNRTTFNGRGGSGNKYAHVVEPGLFQRIVAHEEARIVVMKAQERAAKAAKPSSNSKKSPRVYTEYIPRASSASISTGASGSASVASFPTWDSRPATPAAKISSRLWRPIKRVFEGNGGNSIKGDLHQKHKVFYLASTDEISGTTSLSSTSSLQPPIRSTSLGFNTGHSSVPRVDLTYYNEPLNKSNYNSIGVGTRLRPVAVSRDRAAIKLGTDGPYSGAALPYRSRANMQHHESGNRQRQRSDWV